MNTVLITGGSRGIGAQMVREFSLQGWQVAFGWHQAAAAAQALAQETGATPLQADLRNEEATLGLIRAALRCLSHLDALIVNAGVAWQGLLSDMSTRAYDELMALNLRSAFLCCREIIPHMVSRGQGSILLVSSIEGVTGASCEAAYAASKAGLLGLARSLAGELGPSGIRVNALAPGAVDTDMMASFSQAERMALIESIPLGRIGTTQEVARAARFLCSADAAYITGQVLGVDGGLII